MHNSALTSVLASWQHRYSLRHWKYKQYLIIIRKLTFSPSKETNLVSAVTSKGRPTPSSVIGWRQATLAQSLDKTRVTWTQTRRRYKGPWCGGAQLIFIKTCNLTILSLAAIFRHFFFFARPQCAISIVYCQVEPNDKRTSTCARGGDWTCNKFNWGRSCVIKSLPSARAIFKNIKGKMSQPQ